VAKSRTARFISNQFRDNPRIDSFVTEIHERDAFAAIFAAGGSVRTLASTEVNNLEAAIANVTDFAGEVVAKLRANQQPRQEVA
jgi:chromosome partitioning protein